MAFRLARRTGRTDITAMPLGLDTPSSFGVATLILLPALDEGRKNGMNHQIAQVYAWHVAAMVLVLTGVFKSVCAPLGNAVRNLVPRAGLLGSLAAIAIALIAFLPLLMDIAALPVVGLLSLAVILVSLVAHRPLPGKLPGALVAVVVGVIAVAVCQKLGKQLGFPLVPPPGMEATQAAPSSAPLIFWDLHWWQQVWWAAVTKLPIALPFALATVVGGIDCTESAAAAGDEFDTRTILLTEGLTSVVAGLCGGVIQNTPYIGQPAYKAMGGRAAYTLATALFIGAAGFLGWFTHLFEWLPKAAMFPILVYVGLEITAQSFRATPTHHYPALGIAILPALAYLATVPLDMALGGREPAPFAVETVQTLRCLANGFIVTSLLWAAALAALIDGRLIRSGVYFLIAGGCSLFGVIHSPLSPALLALPDQVMPQLSEAAKYQTPYHWATAYGVTALLLFGLALFRTPSEQEGVQEKG
jgi:AGZA family xanthine/uracil permease-like MFS transporter